ncbi:MAG: Holliday junction resolvase RuvX [Lachnospira sp.]|nr:Holliday junction resolvase RuvX [Lachnospira sp.]
MKIMGLDYGTKTVGVAISDALGITAQGVETITRKESNKLRKTYARIEELIEAEGVEEVVVGLPKNMNDSIGERAQDCQAFAEAINRRTGLNVVMWDERLSTVSAERVLMESGVRREDRKAVIDKVAATIILQGYLDYKANQRKNEIQGL